MPNYREAPGHNYSKMADFNISPDHCLMEKDDRAAFQNGHAIEAILRGDYEKKYVTAEFTIPDDVYAAVQNGDDLEKMIRYNKDGSRNNQSKNKHAAIDFFLAHPGKKVIPEVERNVMRIMAKNLMKAEYEGVTVKRLLDSAKWNTPIFWGDKKAELDCYIELKDEIILLDIKTAASFGQFHKMLKSRYWIQDQHYSEGCEAHFGKQCRKMAFLVATKEKPYLAQCFTIKDESREYGRIAYLELCDKYRDWVAEGKPARGWLEAEEVKVFINRR